ncbi:sensor histidine kinase [Micropruina sp.]|uniref:sensor histidine kinase n=1 Tax=Micropruina sp. TaxID=2737536 RepID=UPI0039E34E24
MSPTDPHLAAALRGPLWRRPNRIPRGSLTATAGLLVAISVLLFGDWSSPVTGLLEIALCIAAGSSGRWLLGGGTATGVLLSLLSAYPLDVSRPSTLAVVLVPVVASSRGSWKLLGLFVAWYLPILALIESGGLAHYVGGLTAWTFALGIAVLVGWQSHRLTLARDRLTRDRALALRAQRRAIARDLHDTVAQATTAVVVRAEAGKLRPGADPETIADLDYIASVARHSLRDLRGMLAAMRAADGEAEPATTLHTETLDQLLDRQVAALKHAGFDVRVLVQARVDELPESVRYTLNCVVSEATTNILRHARPGSGCAVMIGDSDDELDVVVRNETGGRSPVPTNQFGLVGIGERVRALGGSIEAGARGGTWILQVRIPLAPPAVQHEGES